MTQTIAQQLKIKNFPFVIRENGFIIYEEQSSGYWVKREYDANNNVIGRDKSDGYWCVIEYNSAGKKTYFKDSYGFWDKREYDANGRATSYVDSEGRMWKREYDANGELIYSETKMGIIIDKRPKVELTLEEIATKFGVDVNQLKIKK
jgi:YD repeat-containing protein